MVGGVGDSAQAAELAVARAVALAHVLPSVKVRGGAGVAPLQRWLAEVRRRVAAPGPRELAGVLVDAEAMARLVRTGVAAQAQRRAVRRAWTALRSLPPGLVPVAVVQQAAAAAGTVARLECLAEALSGPEHAAAVDRRAAALAEAGDTADAAVLPLLSEEIVSDARSAAMARAAAQALAEYGPELEAAVGVVADQLRGRLVADGEAATAGLRRRLADARRGRTERAGLLAGRLLALAESVDRSRRSAPPGAQAGGTGPNPPGPGLLSWLRARADPGLYTPACEEAMARWLGSDPFGQRALPEPPEFLAGVPVSRLPAEHVAPLLRRISLTRAPPSPRELAPAELDRDRGRVSVVARRRTGRRWGQPPGSGAPLLPRTARVPHVVHGIWLGRPMPASSVFWRNYRAGALRHAGQVDFVVWTDIPRERFARALAEPLPPPGQPDPLADVRALLDWAVENGIHLVNVFEVFHAAAPMTLHPQFVLEMAKQAPAGYASASDHLRVDIVHRFGGVYADGDISFVPADGGCLPESLPQFFDRLAGSEHGFTMNPMGYRCVNNDIVAAPARHPAIALWLERARLNYSCNQPQLFGGVGGMARHLPGIWRQLRYIAPLRTGRIQHQVLAAVGISADSLPATRPAFQASSEMSWVRPAGGEAPEQARPDDPDHVVTALAKCLTFLQWQLVARTGNLYLSAVEPVIRVLPDPDAAWTALLSTLPALGTGLPPVTSITDVRRDDDGGLEPVVLPPEADALLDRSATPHRWLGAPLSPGGMPVWLLGERVAPARLRPAGEPSLDYTGGIGRLGEIAVDAFGHPIGLWFRSPPDADRWRSHPRFTALPPDHVGVDLGAGTAGTVEELNLHPESVAALLLELGMAGRPVQLTVPRDTGDFTRPFATRLRHLLEQPVHLAEKATDPRTVLPLHPPLLPVRYLPVTSFQAGLPKITGTCALDR